MLTRNQAWDSRKHAEDEAPYQRPEERLAIALERLRDVAQAQYAVLSVTLAVVVVWVVVQILIYTSTTR
jgi:hypothetical protein